MRGTTYSSTQRVRRSRSEIHKHDKTTMQQDENKKQLNGFANVPVRVPVKNVLRCNNADATLTRTNKDRRAKVCRVNIRRCSSIISVSWILAQIRFLDNDSSFAKQPQLAFLREYATFATRNVQAKRILKAIRSIVYNQDQAALLQKCRSLRKNAHGPSTNNRPRTPSEVRQLKQGTVRTTHYVVTALNLIQLKRQATGHSAQRKLIAIIIQGGNR